MIRLSKNPVSDFHVCVFYVGTNVSSRDAVLQVTVRRHRPAQVDIVTSVPAIEIVNLCLCCRLFLDVDCPLSTIA